MNLQDKLEEIKQLGNYAVTVYYGCGIGCDDVSDSPKDRQIKVVAFPVGVLGEAKILWTFEKVSEFLETDLSAHPTVVSNPPSYDDTKAPGVYLWGTEFAVKKLTVVDE